MKNSKLITVSMCVYCAYSEIEPLLKQAHEQGVEDAENALRDLFPHKY